MKGWENSWHIRERHRGRFELTGHVEWKYLNFSAGNVSGIFVYFFSDPKKLPGVGGASVIGRIYKDGEIHGGIAHFPMAKIAASSQNADIEIGGNYIRQKGKTYSIRGKAENVSWELHYSPILSPISGINDVSLDFLNLERMSWRVQMPKARVVGRIKIGKRSFAVRSLGYTDANWGDVIPLSSQFVWGQYNDKKFSAVFAEIENFEIAGRKIGRWAGAFADLRGKKMIFRQKNVVINYDEWKMIPKTKIKVPTVQIVRAENDDWLLFLDMKAVYSDPMQFKMPFSFPVRPTTVEQSALVSGGLFDKKSNKLLHPINGWGFMEYTLRNLDLSGKRPKSGILV